MKYSKPTVCIYGHGVKLDYRFCAHFLLPLKTVLGNIVLFVHTLCCKVRKRSRLPKTKASQLSYLFQSGA